MLKNKITKSFSYFFKKVFNRDFWGEAELGVLFANKIFLINFIISLILNLVVWLLLYMQFQPTQEPVILHYNIYFGIDLIGDWYKIFALPLFGFIIFFINFFFSIIIYHKEKILSYILIFSSSVIQIFLGLASLFIIFQNL
ncbi:MAG: hypothetical protein U5L76_05965 [Patescibacteria group bacterium]|nr:hypothetical protein [Patescibacteria group bacterium]